MAKKSAEDAAEIAAIQASMRMNLDDAFQKVVNGATAGSNTTASASGGGLIDKRSDSITVAGKKVEQHHMDWDSMLSKLGRNPSPQSRGSNGQPAQNNTISFAMANRVMESYKPVINELNKFRFASSPEKKAEQIDQILGFVKEAMQKVAVNQVLSNTKAYYQNATAFARLVNDDSTQTLGLKVTFQISDEIKVAMSAEGRFYGDEIIGFEHQNDGGAGYVIRPREQSFDDITSEFKIALKMV